jgi:glycosyltransferase involved in cell wall biosynthesis
MTSIYALPTILLQRIKFYNNAINDAPPKVPFFSKEGFRSSITYPLSTKIFANSLAGIVSYHPPRSKTICIYNGFDLSRIENLTPEEEVKNRFKISSAFVVGMVGSFTSFKDYDSYIKAAQLILSKRRDVTFLAIGDGPTLKTMQESVSADNKSHILFLGNQSNVESIINIFNIGVLSTYSEGISNSIMEYMALSKPAVSVDEGGTRELIMDGVTGFLVPPKSPELLAQKIETLLNDTRLMQEMGARGRERIIDKFSLREMVTAYIDQYCQ